MTVAVIRVNAPLETDVDAAFQKTREATTRPCSNGRERYSVATGPKPASVIRVNGEAAIQA
jgi:hypothetical protein